MEIVKVYIRGLSQLLWRSDLHMFMASFIIWILFGDHVIKHTFSSFTAQFFFAILISGLTVFTLRSFSFFHSLRILPRKSDIFLAVLIIPILSLLIYYAFALVLSEQNQSFGRLILLSPFLAVAVFSTYTLFSIIHSKFGPKKHVVLDISIEEINALLEDIELLGLSQNVILLTKHDLKEHLLKGDAHVVNLIIISKTTVNQFEEDAVLLRAHLAGVPIVDFNSLRTELTGQVRLSQNDMWSYVLSATPQTSLLRFFQASKIFVEPVIALLIGITLSPIMVVLAILIKMTSPGPVFYKQVRTGYLGRNFTLIKFRSMHIDAESDGSPKWCQENDARITKIGSFMRKTRLDELPQLINVIKGEMGFFGPRPERPEIYRSIKKEIPLFSLRTLVRPGITGWAQVFAGYAASVEESKIKLEFDLFYIQNMSPRLDLIILIKTIQLALFGEKSSKIPQNIVLTNQDLALKEKAS